MAVPLRHEHRRAMTGAVLRFRTFELAEFVVHGLRVRRKLAVDDSSIQLRIDNHHGYTCRAEAVLSGERRLGSGISCRRSRRSHSGNSAASAAPSTAGAWR